MDVVGTVPAGLVAAWWRKMLRRLDLILIPILCRCFWRWEATFCGPVGGQEEGEVRSQKGGLEGGNAACSSDNEVAGQ